MNLKSHKMLSILAGLLLAFTVACSDDSPPEGDGTPDADYSDVVDSGDGEAPEEDSQSPGEPDALEDDSSGEDTEEEEDADVGPPEEDAGAEDIEEEDAAETPDAEEEDAAGESDTTDPGEELPEVCDDECRDEPFSIEMSGEMDELTHGAYGLTARPDGSWEVYIESWKGGFTGCPTDEGATPNWTLILPVLELPLDSNTLTKGEDGVSLIFFDYDGLFLEGIEPTRATDVTVTPVAANIDIDRTLAGEKHEEGVVALDVDGIFPEGIITGRLVAGHCPIMDRPDGP